MLEKIGLERKLRGKKWKRTNSDLRTKTTSGSIWECTRGRSCTLYGGGEASFPRKSTVHGPRRDEAERRSTNTTNKRDSRMSSRLCTRLRRRGRWWLLQRIELHHSAQTGAWRRHDGRALSDWLEQTKYIPKDGYKSWEPCQSKRIKGYMDPLTQTEKKQIEKP